MENENIIIKGISQKNKIASIILTTSLIAICFALYYSYYAYQYLERYFLFGYGYGGTWYYHIGYNDDFMAFFIGEYLTVDLMYGYIFTIGIIAFIVSIVMKKTTEGGEIAVTNSNIIGKLADGKNIDIPLNQITALNSISFDGISVSSIGNISNFHCIENRDEVIKTISCLLTNPQQGNIPVADPNTIKTSASGNETEQLKKLKELLDADILTQEEFDAKKKQLLGL